MTAHRSPAGLAACVAVWIVAIACQEYSRTQQGSSDTKRVLDTIASTRQTLTPQDWEAARRMNDEGDREYRLRHYRAAFTAYANSYPNAPTAHGYIMAGDARLRMMTADETLPSQRNSEPCRVDNTHFAHDLALDLAQHQVVGFALAAQETDRTIVVSPMYRRARSSVDCLQRLAREYESRPASECVDLSRLRRCLGDPLLDAQ
jgi:hypothetical protein